MQAEAVGVQEEDRKWKLTPHLVTEWKVEQCNNEGYMPILGVISSSLFCPISRNDRASSNFSAAWVSEGVITALVLETFPDLGTFQNAPSCQDVPTYVWMCLEMLATDAIAM
eukprot:scaffold75754_cov17-Tisochrysis_lutea.AAC.1